MINLYLKDSLTNQLKLFTPIYTNHVNIYACGITPYDYSHIGHARSAITWDILRRYLSYLNYKVVYINNVTDIDDKIINKAKLTHAPALEVSDYYFKEYQKDLANLNVLPAVNYPKVSNNISRIIQFINGLFAKGAAYLKEDGVYFNLKKAANYGKLSNRDSQSCSYQDFALWKLTDICKKELITDNGWDSPWGYGRPGWHIECSTFIHTYIGDTVDIHCGGSDLLFPHHENEIAQSETLTGKPLANYWLHNGMVKIAGQKMSKSLGNFITIKSVTNKYHPMTLRMLFLQSGYSKPINITEDSLQAAPLGQNSLRAAESLYLKYEKVVKGAEIDLAYMDLFSEYMSDDLNTAKVVALMSNLYKKKLYASLKAIMFNLGLL
jgi:cysteinyl-tRNA synthetase